VSDIQHVTIYRAPGRFAGWPANYGIWSWGDEIVVGFVVGQFKASVRGHACDHEQPFVTMQARSLDGGLTWDTERMPGPDGAPIRSPGGRALSADEHVIAPLRAATALTAGLPYHPTRCPGIKFTHPDFALLCGRTGLTAGAVSWFYTSTDRCRSWDGPYALPDFGLPGIAARTDYLVSSPDECLLFLTAAKSNGEEGRPFCARTTDGGRTWRFVAWIGPEPAGYAIMPSSARLASGRILTAIRCSAPDLAGNERQTWIDLYASEDDGATWQAAGRPVSRAGNWGNPPSMIRLRDVGESDALALTYGYRDAPYGTHARISRDGGAAWGEEIVLRADGGCRDLGYPRSVQRSDDKIVTVYYYNDDPDRERYIAATVWEPEQ
jgi:hypothetical protein